MALASILQTRKASSIRVSLNVKSSTKYTFPNLGLVKQNPRHRSTQPTLFEQGDYRLSAQSYLITLAEWASLRFKPNIIIYYAFCPIADSQC
jgi:hypothetical protein